MSKFNRFQYNAVGFVSRATDTLVAVYAARRLPRALAPEEWRLADAERRALRDLSGLVWC